MGVIHTRAPARRGAMDIDHHGRVGIIHTRAPACIDIHHHGRVGVIYTPALLHVGMGEGEGLEITTSVLMK